MIFVEMNDHFGVGMICAKPVSRAEELIAELDMVVDFAIEDGRERFGLVEDGLLAGFEIDDCQAAHAERDVAAFPISGFVLDCYERRCRSCAARFAGRGLP